MKKVLTEKIICLGLVFSLIAFHSGAQRTKSVFKEDEKIKLAILMYHGFSSGKRESTYVIDEKSLEDDIIYLKENGFSFISCTDLTDFIDYNKPLPEKCVMLTFDDGYYNNYLYAFPIIKKHGVKVTILPIASCSEEDSISSDSNPAYSHMTWEQIREVSNSGLIEIQNHSYDMHSLNNGRRGSAKAFAETGEDYRYIFFKDLLNAHTAIKNATGKSPYAYAYPFGSVSYETRAILKCFGYRMSFGCEEGINYITRDKDSLYMLKRFNRSNEKNAQMLLDGY